MKFIYWDEITKWEERGDTDIVMESINGVQLPVFVEIDGYSIGILELNLDNEDHYVFDPPTNSTLKTEPDLVTYHVYGGAWSFAVENNVAVIPATGYRTESVKSTCFKSWFRRNNQYLDKSVFDEVAKRLQLGLDYETYETKAFETDGTFQDYAEALRGRLDCIKFMDNFKGVMSQASEPTKTNNGEVEQ